MTDKRLKEIKDIDGWKDYTIDTNGNVFSKRRNVFLKQHISKNGYCIVTLQINKHRKTFPIHRLVAKAFISNPNNYPYINHIDSNKLNNNVNNLEWCTPKQNTQHAVKNHRFDNMASLNSKLMKEREVWRYRWCRNDR